jgi:hypothetical protein
MLAFRPHLASSLGILDVRFGNPGTLGSFRIADKSGTFISLSDGILAVDIVGVDILGRSSVLKAAIYYPALTVEDPVATSPHVAASPALQINIPLALTVLL